MKNKKIAIGLSGGVDSSVAASLLMEQGYDVIGVHMIRWNTDMPGCTGDADRADALKIAKKLGIPFRTIDLRQHYQEQVIERFLEEFKQGRTPNPDIWCNEFIKFGAFQDYALNQLGVDAIATGHYARINEIPNGWGLYTGIDDKKDQSYFLYRLTEEQLSRSVFPLGGYTKDQIRLIAAERGLATANKPDSVGICFIGDIDLTQFLKEYLILAEGEVVDTDGRIIGRHEGVPLYTIGQRHGFTLTDYQGLPVYVIGKDIENNRLIVGRGERTLIDSFDLLEMHWIHNHGLTVGARFDNITIRVRHLGDRIPVKLNIQENGVVSYSLQVPVNGVAAGQHGVIYKDDQVLGGGVVSYSLH